MISHFKSKVLHGADNSSFFPLSQNCVATLGSFQFLKYTKLQAPTSGPLFTSAFHLLNSHPSFTSQPKVSLKEAFSDGLGLVGSPFHCSVLAYSF